ncbi:hypothetical protein [Vitiosangium sp. GDMCC 1.1324]|uniref:hypothetical protein n=1 Tax=Vitiosangium sp. (strain GDMCC 1.1324) TaxID=2138576 RepID=UPI000D45C04C|nr:hypothetical protein [Vitiosangium sp. GDMCC 1.1324]PTL74922.1 hypothetical protein DAT35_57710 [Vitiosangium sp. GDMCC 1.1324]
MTPDHPHDDHAQPHGDRPRHGHRHGHHHDRRARAVLRYLRLLPLMWRSKLNDTVVRELAIKPGESLRRGDILETSRGLKAPGPETAELPAASGPD